MGVLHVVIIFITGAPRGRSFLRTINGRGLTMAVRIWCAINGPAVGGKPVILVIGGPDWIFSSYHVGQF